MPQKLEQFTFGQRRFIGAAFETDSEERNILDWIKLFNFETDLAQFEGQKHQ
ncbi:MAG: hypothetical protein IPN96_19555 [Anaerolineales bacterium]|nr:hypothetical protein [Anaerolineales bacterium]